MGGSTRHRSGVRAVAHKALLAVTTMLTMCASVVALEVSTAPPAAAAVGSDSLGTDFWLAFPGNAGGPGELSLFLTGPTATTGTVAGSRALFSQPFSVTPGTVTTVVVPSSTQINTSNTVARPRHPCHGRGGGHGLRPQPRPADHRRVPRSSHRHPRHGVHRAGLQEHQHRQRNPASGGRHPGRHHSDHRADRHHQWPRSRRAVQRGVEPGADLPARKH